MPEPVGMDVYLRRVREGKERMERKLKQKQMQDDVANAAATVVRSKQKMSAYHTYKAKKRLVTQKTNQSLENWTK